MNDYAYVLCFIILVVRSSVSNVQESFIRIHTSVNGMIHYDTWHCTMHVLCIMIQLFMNALIYKVTNTGNKQLRHSVPYVRIGSNPIKEMDH